MTASRPNRRESLRTLARLGLAGGLMTTLGGCGTIVRAVREETSGIAAPGPTRRTQAETAWRYFESTINPATGLAESVAGAGFTSCASLGDQIAATLCAYRLGLLTPVRFDGFVSRILAFLAQAPLAGGALPGRFYDTSGGQLLDPPARDGDPGWSGAELGRLLLWLRALATGFSQYAGAIETTVGQWRLCDALDEQGRILAALPTGANGLTRAPEITSSYTAYAAQGYRAWGLAPARTVSLTSDFSVSVEGLDFPIGSAGNARPALQPVPFALLGIELGWKGIGDSDLATEKAMLERMFEAQDRRRLRTGIVTARGDFRRTSAPYALTSGVVATGTPWGTMGEDGMAHPDYALLATKTAFAMWALRAPSAEPAMASATTLLDPGGGWLEGRYENSAGQEWTRTAATNALVLESLLHREVGQLIKLSAPVSNRACT